MRNQIRFAIAALAGALLLAGCGKKSADDQPLAYAPADTPYLLANLEPVPAEALDAWWKSTEQMMPMYDSMMKSMLETLQRDASDETAAKVVRAVFEEMQGKLNKAGFESLGFTPTARTAAYGIGLVPVLRMELGDPDKFKALVARIEAKVGETLPQLSIADQPYWRIGGADSPGALIMAVQGRQLVLTVVPKSPTDATLRQLLGLDRPAQNALEAGTLEAFNRQMKYLPYGSGYVDTTRLAAAFAGERTPLEREFMIAMGAGADAAAVTPECKAEYAAMAANVPRVSFGYTGLEGKRMALSYIAETKPEYGKDLAALAAAVPGLTGKGSAMLDFGYGIDVNALVRFVGARAAAVASAPYQCESLAPLNEKVAKLNTDLSNPSVFMIGAALKGINASLSRLDMPEGGMPVLEGKLAIASDNPQSLLSMAGGFAPQLATLNLSAGAAPVALPDGLLPPGAPPAYLALGPQALAISIGEGQQGSLSAFAAAAPGSPAPLLYYGVDGNGMSAFLKSMTRTLETQIEMAEQMAAFESAPGDDGEGEEGDSVDTGSEKVADMRETLAAMKTMETIYAQSMQRVDFSLFATERGLEVQYAIELK